MATTSKEVVQAVQHLLRLTDPKLVADGWWGTRTNAAYAATDSGTRSLVDRVLQQNGVSPDQLLQETRVVTRDASLQGPGWIPEDKVNAIVLRVATEVGLPPDLLMKFVEIEAAQKVVNGTRMFNAESLSPGNGTYKGLFQMGRAAWTDVQRRVKDFPGFELWKDPYINALAGAHYAKVNMATARSSGYTGPFTAQVLYAMHNQGVGGFMRLLRERKVNGNVTNQSRQAQAIIRSAAQQAGVMLA